MHIVQFTFTRLVWVLVVRYNALEAICFFGKFLSLETFGPGAHCGLAAMGSPVNLPHVCLGLWIALLHLALLWHCSSHYCNRSIAPYTSRSSSWPWRWHRCSIHSSSLRHFWWCSSYCCILCMCSSSCICFLWCLQGAHPTPPPRGTVHISTRASARHPLFVTAR
jgi:hypothetical protein